jgi:hypothetical protein
MTMPPEVRELVRNFADNSCKFLLRDRENARELVAFLTPPIAARIDFRQMRPEPTTFIASDFRHLESDLLLRAPLRGKGRQRPEVDVYLLFEHQSEPDEHAVFRAARYVMQVFDLRLREWLKAHTNARGCRFHPVLPIIVYTGSRTWERPPALHELVEEGELFRDYLPALAPVFFNLAQIREEALGGIGALGQALRVTRHRQAERGLFEATLADVVRHVDALPGSQHERRGSLMWYLHALVYYQRGRSEYEPMAELIRETVRRDHKKEAGSMEKTIAEAWREEGEVIGALRSKRETLLRQLRLRFKRIPKGVETRIQSTRDSGQLDRWLDAVVTAESLADIPFDAP